MANFSTANWVKAQPKLIGKFQANELRFRDPVVHKLYLRNTEIMVPSYMELRKSTDRTVEANYFTRTSRALGSAISHNHTGAQGDSSTLTPTWTTYTDAFVSTLKEANNSIYDINELHASKIENAIINFVEGLETAAAAFNFANRSGVNVTTTGGTFDAVDDTFEITKATNVDQAIQITKSSMDDNKYQGMGFTIVCDAESFILFEKQANQGTGNSTNLSFQYSNVTFIKDVDLAAAAAGLVSAYSLGYWIAVPDGYVAALPWIPVQNRVGADMKEATYSNMYNPIDGIQLGTHTYEERVDGTGVGGQLQDVKIETQLFTDLSYEVAPSSTANETPLLAFAFV